MVAHRQHACISIAGLGIVVQLRASGRINRIPEALHCLRRRLKHGIFVLRLRRHHFDRRGGSTATLEGTMQVLARLCDRIPWGLLQLRRSSGGILHLEPGNSTSSRMHELRLLGIPDNICVG